MLIMLAFVRELAQLMLVKLAVAGNLCNGQPS